MPDTSTHTNETTYDFSVLSPLVKATETPEGDWIVYGSVASSKKDYDGEILESAGIRKGLEMFKKLGSQVDWEHQYHITKNPAHVIGKGVHITDVDGVPHLATKLFKSKPIAQELWRHLQDDGAAGYSIEGIVKARDPKDSKRILDTEIHRVTISMSPKGFDNRIRAGMPTDMVGMLKAIASGDAAPLTDNAIIPPSEPPVSFGTGEPVAKGADYAKASGGTPDVARRADEPQSETDTCTNCKAQGSLHLDSPRPGLAHCPDCGFKTTVQAHRQSIAKKAVTTGEGVVAEGDSEPGDASALRKQALLKKLKSSQTEMEKRLAALGVTNPEVVAKAIAARIQSALAATKK